MLQLLSGILAHRPRDGVHGMDMENHWMWENRVHGSFNRSTRINVSGVNMLADMSPYLSQIQGNEDIFMFCVRQPSP